MTTEQAFWTLLKAGLWNKAPQDFDAPLTEEQWKALMQMAKEQTLMGVLYDGMNLLPAELQPPQALRMTWFWSVNKIEQTNRLINRVLVQFLEKLEAEGIRPLLLKGQYNATLYPQPLHRQCGDIDLFVGRKDYPKACTLVREWGMSGDEDEESLKHLHCDWQGVTIELHRVAAIMPWSSKQRYFLQWSEEVLQTSEETFIPTTEEKPVRVSNPEFNVLFVFYHMYHHFLNIGVGLRQLCDCARLLHVHAGQIDVKELEERLQQLDLIHPWQVFGTLLVQRLGLPESECPFYKNEEQKAEKVLAVIEREGNFGRYSGKKKPDTGFFLWLKLKRFLFNSARYPMVMRLFPKDTLQSYGFFIIDRGKLFIDHFKKR